MKHLTAISLAAAMVLQSASFASAMSDSDTVSMGRSMLTGAIYNSLRSGGYDTTSLERLTLGEVALINNLLHSDSMGAGDVDGQIKLILDRASKR